MYLSIISLSSTLIIRSIKDIIYIVKYLKDNNQSKENYKIYYNSTKSINLLIKRYNNILKEGEATRDSIRKSSKQLSKSQIDKEKKKR